jgi:hypothetical protein
MKPYKMTANKKPTGLALRRRLSDAIVSIARWINPDNPEVMAYVMEKTFDAYMETLIYGQSTTCPHCMSVIKKEDKEDT